MYAIDRNEEKEMEKRERERERERESCVFVQLFQKTAVQGVKRDGHVIVRVDESHACLCLSVSVLYVL